MKNWLIGNISWIAPTVCGIWGGLLGWFDRRIAGKLSRNEFDAWRASIEQTIAEMRIEAAEQSKSQSNQHLEIAKQIGALQATLEALKESSSLSDQHLKELIDLSRSNNNDTGPGAEEGV